jgi:hypothetical protein
MTRAEQIDFEQAVFDAFGQVKDFTLAMRIAKYFYEQAERDILAIVNEYMEKGERCMQQAGENGEQGVYTFWDGFHNCAENILRELEK